MMSLATQLRRSVAIEQRRDDAINNGMPAAIAQLIAERCADKSAPMVYIDNEVIALASDNDRLSNIIYGRNVRLDGHEASAVAHLDEELRDLRDSIAEKERARAALIIREARG